MTLQQLRCLDAIARTGSFRAAARELYLTQPAVSLHIAKLEKELGNKLLFRTPKGSELTEAGSHLLPYLQAVLAAELLVTQKAEEERSVESTPIKIWAMPLALELLETQVTQALRADAPTLQLQFKPGSPREILQAIYDGDCEIGIVGHFGRLSYSPDMTVIPLLKAKPAAIAPLSHELLTSKSLTRTEFAEQPLVAVERSHTMARVFEDYTSGLPTNVVAAACSEKSVHEIVESGQGVSLSFDLNFWNKTESDSTIGFRYPDDLDLDCNICAITPAASRNKETLLVLQTLQAQALARQEQIHNAVMRHRVKAPS